MKIEITEEMREALRRWAIYRASHAELKNPTPGQDLALDEEAHRIARLVAEAVERAEQGGRDA